MSGGEFAAIECCRSCGLGKCYVDAEARVGIPALLAAVRERDNTIARVRAIAAEYASPRLRQRQQAEGMQIAAAAILAALDPQETPDGRM